jgi:dolichol-phosphate mannosyltransferase
MIPRRRELMSVVLPVYHNRAQLPELHRRLTAVLGQLADRYELVFVDDAGQDGSLEWLRQCRQEDDHVVLVEMPHNGGQHQAVATGLRVARGELVAVMDADLQDVPETLPRLVAALAPGVGVVFARRAARHQSRGRHVSGRLFKRLLRRLTGSRVPAGTGMYFVTSRVALDAALAVPEQARYVPLLFDHAGVTMTAVEVGKDLRPDIPSAYTTAKRLRLAVGAFRQAVAWRHARKQATRVSSALGTDDRRQRHPLAGQEDDADQH